MIGKVLAVAVGLAGSAVALPGGAPGCNVMGVAKMTGGENMTQDLGYTIAAPATYTAGDMIELTVNNADGMDINGLLIYAEPMNDPKARVGTFMDFNEDNWQPGKCPDECPDGICALTHTNPDGKPSPLTLNLQLPETDMGDLVIRAAVAQNAKTYQILDDVTIASAGGEDLGAVDPVPGVDPGVCECQPVRRCKKFKNGASPGI